MMALIVVLLVLILVFVAGEDVLAIAFGCLAAYVVGVVLVYAVIFVFTMLPATPKVQAYSEPAPISASSSSPVMTIGCDEAEVFADSGAVLDKVVKGETVTLLDYSHHSNWSFDDALIVTPKGKQGKVHVGCLLENGR